MAKIRLRTLVLAAGRGERLRPLTDTVPKPLLPVAGTPVAGYTLERLAAAGCEAAALNLHHLGAAIRGHLGDEIAGMPLTYSEEPERLGTLGALYPLRDFLSAADLVLVINGDSLCRWPIKRLVKRHRASGAAATLLFSRRADPMRFGGGVVLSQDGRRVESFEPPHPGDPDERRRVFAGAQVLSPELLGRLEPGHAETVPDLYRPLLAEGAHLEAVETRARWHDLGTPRRYLEGALDQARGTLPGSLWRRSRVSPEAIVSRRARWRRSVVEAGARLDRGCRLDRALVMRGARVAEGCRLESTILGPGAVLPPGTRLENRVVTRAREGAIPQAGDSRVGDLVFTPFDGTDR